MSGISSGVGLISGINTSQLIDQLIAIEARPVTFLQNRVKTLDTQRTAYAQISATLLALKNATLSFKKSTFFQQFAANSSNPSSVTATADSGAQLGTTSLRVLSLVSNHVLLSRGFADADHTPIGLGTISVESAQGKVDHSTELAALNGGRGVKRGNITIADRSGATATVDLTKAFTVDDVLEAINSNTQVHVHASVTGLASNGATGDRIVIEDQSGGSGNLVIGDVASGTTAQDLGIVANAASSRVDGRGLLFLGNGTSLASLNDGNGVDRFAQGATAPDLQFTTTSGNFNVSFTDVLSLDTNLQALNGGNGVRLGTVRITDRTGASKDVDLSNAKTVRDVRDAINASGLNVSATTVNSFFFVTDTTTVDPNLPADQKKQLKIEDVTGHTAADLGLKQTSAGDSIRGNDVYRVSTVGDVLRAINFAPGNNGLVQASISSDGRGITLQALNAGDSVTVTAGVGTNGGPSQAAADLGLLNATFTGGQSFASRPLISGLNTTDLRSLNGGKGVSPGVVSFTDSQGNLSTIDFSSVRTLQDVIDTINTNPDTLLRASVNATGNGFQIQDSTEGTNPIVISDVSGTFAADLHIAGSHDVNGGAVVNSGNLQRQYVSRATLLSSLNGGDGVQAGSFQIHDSNGGVVNVDLSGNLKTIGQVVDAINLSAPATIRAQINDTGDGISIVDSSGGPQTISITDNDGSSTAGDLRLLGSSKPGQNFIDGSFETRISVDAGDSLSDVVTKLNAAGGGFTANVVNDGSGANSYSLLLTSTVSGRRGELVVDGGSIDLGVSTLTRPQDALISLGQSGGGSVLISSNSNQLKNVIPGITLNLLTTSDHDVTVTTSQDAEPIVEAMKSFIEKYNGVQSAIIDDTKFDSKTKTAGPLLGDNTVTTVRERLQSAITQSFSGASNQLSRMFAVGLSIGSDNRLTLNEDKFRAALQNSPGAVADLFATLDKGFGSVVDKTISGLTDAGTGVIARQDKLLTDQEQILNDRITSMNALLDAKRLRLQAQFSGLETTLSALQGQQNSLSSLAQLAASGK
ncbi:MAG: flagellar filament capping protein FliD [Planctomycetes bacterium]|nr:flagellar filament capping protein FliD [Planctomycetota bacterium]MBI3833043.1 flagellar filament capping protein FliD [Planctomycetota bacterium]